MILKQARYMSFDYGSILIWIVTDKFPMVTAARTAKSGLLFGLIYGFTQDALSLAKGRRLAYVDFLLGTNRRQMWEARFEEEMARQSTS